MAVTTSVTISGAKVALTFPIWHASNGVGLRGVIACHGHAGDYTQIAQGRAWAGHPEYWADYGGCVVGMVSTGDTWAQAAGAMTPITNLANYMRDTLGIVGRVGAAGWSMGGLDILRWTLENMARVAVGWVVSPAQDLDSDEANAAWTTEIDNLYGGSHATYLAQGSPRSPLNNAAAFRGGPKFQIVHATDDPTIPYAQSTALVAAVGDGTITMRQPDIVGGHQAGLTGISPSESLAWLRNNWAA